MALVVDLLATYSVEVTEQRRLVVKEYFQLPTEYTLMLYGKSALPNMTGLHYELVEKGVTTTGTAGYNLLYNTHECLRDSDTPCMSKNNSLYQYVSNGLDRAMQAHISEIYAMLGMHGVNPIIISCVPLVVYHALR